MKLAALLKVAAPFLATDKKPEELRRAIIAADKKAKDAEGSGLGARELEEKDKAKAQDAREAAMDEREEAMDAAEEKADKEKAEDKAAKDRKAARDKRAADRAARALDRSARDRNDDPEHTNDEDLTEGADPSTPGGSRAGGKTAIDSAEIDRRIAAAVAADRAAQVALFDARREVEPILGIVAMDSAEAVYRTALDKLGVDHKGVHASALRALVGVAKDRSSPQGSPPAMDSAASSDFASKIPGYGRLK